MKRLFLSPCGTSLLTNDRISPISDDLKTVINQTANLSESELKSEEKKLLSQHIEEREKLLLSEETDLNMIKRMSAELNTIITYYGGFLPVNSADYHYLLCTDTYQGQKTAQMVEKWLKKRGFNVEIKPFRGLKTDKDSDFRLAMSDLINWCDDDNLQAYRRLGYKIIFNLTGGFKSVQGFLQTIGMFYADEIVYIFQSSRELLKIPRLPISLDGNVRQVIEENLIVIRQLGMGKLLTLSDCENIPETLLLQIDNQVSLSPWGELIWKQAKPSYYQKELLPPLSPKLQYSSEFQKGVKSLSSDRLEIINKRLDDLSQCLDKNLQYNPVSLDFKKLQGKPLKQSTHECDGWSDQDAKRLYGHFENKIYIIDELGKHL